MKQAGGCSPDEAIAGPPFTLLSAGYLGCETPGLLEMPTVDPEALLRSRLAPSARQQFSPVAPPSATEWEIPYAVGGGGVIVGSVSPGDRFNYLFNPGFEFWTEAAAFNNPPSGTPITKGWTSNKAGTPAFTVSRESVPSEVASGTYALKVDVTAGVPAERVDIAQEITSNGPEFTNRSVTFACAIKAFLPSTVRLAIVVVGGASFQSAFHSGGGSYETLTVTALLPAVISSLRFEVQVDASIPQIVRMDEARASLETSANSYRVPTPAEMSFNRLELIETKRIAASVGSVTFTGLNGNSDEQYILSGRIKNGQAGASFVTLRPNGIVAAQSTEKVTGIAGAVAAANVADFRVAEPQSLFTSWIFCKIAAKTGLPRYLFSTETQQRAAATASLFTFAGLWNDVTTNITSLGVFSSLALGLGAGTELTLYRLARV
jgi:hypothetical protein